jgi:hypothetical protein
MGKGTNGKSMSGKGTNSKGTYKGMTAGKRMKKTKRHQKIYKMKGCSKTRRNYLGGENINGVDRTMPNTGPPLVFGSTIPSNTLTGQNGGCGCGMPLLSGGGTPGFVGAPWTPSSDSWPGVKGDETGTYIAPNNYNNDVQLATKYVGANPPFSTGGKKKNKRRSHGSKKQRGGNLSNFLGQDLINLGRSFEFGLGSAYNGLAGYHAPRNPLPWVGQLNNTSNLNTIKGATL